MTVSNLNFRHLRAFVMTVRLGTVVAAARAVNLSQPAVTQAIAGLEEQLSVSLFERSATGMEPTEAARLLLPRAETTLQHIGSTRATNTQARALAALAREGSYAAASLATGLAQSSLHRAVSDLEIVLEAKLVTRRGRGIEFTREGRAVARNFRLAHSELQAALSELSALSGRSICRIVIGAMPLCRARLLPEAVLAFREKHGEVEIAITEGPHVELVEPLRDGELDILIGALRDPGPGPDLAQSPLFEDRPVVVARHDHPIVLARKTGQGLRQLSKYPWVMPPKGVPLRMQWEALFERAGLPVPHVPIECASVITIRQILMGADYLTVLSPDQVAVELEAGWLRVIGPSPDALRRTIGVTTRTGWRPTAMHSAFIDTLRNVAAD